MTEIYLYFLFAHYGLYGNAPVRSRALGLPADADGSGSTAVMPVTLAVSSLPRCLILPLCMHACRISRDPKSPEEKHFVVGSMGQPRGIDVFMATPGGGVGGTGAFPYNP